MSIKPRHPSRHDDPHEDRLREIVSLLVADGREQPAYLTFARELMHAERRSVRRENPEFRNQRPECRGRRQMTKPEARMTIETRIPNAETTDERRWTQMRDRQRTPVLRIADWKLGTAPARVRPFPDYSRRTKLVVMRWFKRGLHGHLLWLVGQAAIREVRMTKSE